MTALEIYVYFVLPVILLAMGYGAVRLADHDRRKLDRRAPAE